MTRRHDPLYDLLAAGEAVRTSRPWSRAVVGVRAWRASIEALAAGRLTLTALWGEARTVHMALLHEADGRLGILSLPCPRGRFPSVGSRHAPAIRLERALCEMTGLVAEGAPDPRPWLDHGRWGVAHPLGVPAPAPKGRKPYAFLPVEGEDLHQIPVGPVHAGVIEPGHFRFTANGETVVRLEERLGYCHRGVETLMIGSPIDDAAKLAARVCGDSTVAYSTAFARAVEAATGIEAPKRAHWLRALMAEIERLANHLGDIGAICNDAAFLILHAHTSILREEVLRTADRAVGHRLMMDRVVPGGVTVDVSDDGVRTIGALIAQLRGRFPGLVGAYDDTASLQDRTVATGQVSTELVRRFGAGGFVGRASGRAFDARRALPYAPYDALDFETPRREDGDVNARVWIRIEEVEQSLRLIEQLLGDLPPGPTQVEVPRRSGEGSALVEGFRGDVFVWVRTGRGGRVERCHLRDPSWFQWPLLEAAIEGNIVADFPLCNKSFNCAYAGADL